MSKLMRFAKAYDEVYELSGKFEIHGRSGQIFVPCCAGTYNRLETGHRNIMAGSYINSRCRKAAGIIIIM